MRSLLSLLSDYAQQTANGYSASDAWSKAWNWGVTALSLNEGDIRQLKSLLLALSDDKVVVVSYFDCGEKSATIRWARGEEFPSVL